ncbi:MAG: caspase family protein [Deltaproteobacteria bacterium]|nr:caspase family protein [Deltaproteobacteria bacterium]
MRKEIYTALGLFIFCPLILCSCASTEDSKWVKRTERAEQIRIERLKELEMFKKKRREAKEKPEEERYMVAKKPIPSVPKIAPVAKPAEVEIEPVAKKPAKIEKIVTLPKIGKYYAVIIGIGKYQDDKIPTLKYTTVDAEEMYNILTDPQYGNFPKDQVKLLIDEQATYNNIKSAIGTWLRRNTRKDDTVIIFFAGHGAPEDEKTYWITYNANIDDLYGTALSNDEIADMLDRVEAKKMVAFLDSCYSAATVNRTDKKRSIMIVKDPFQKFKGKGRVIIASSDGKEESLEIEKFGHGVFTHYLLKALKGEADENKDGFVELDEVWDYVKYRVTDTARKYGSTQTPIIDGSYSAGIVLSKHPERLKELELEAEIEKKEKELEVKIVKLTELYSKGEITDSQFDKAVGMLKSGQKNKLLDSFLSGKISLTTFKTAFK